MITDISQLDPNGTYTYADYLKWQFDERIELIRGKLYRMSPALQRVHQLAVSHLLVDISLYVGTTGCDVVDVYESGEIPSRIFPDLLVSHDRIFR